MNNEQAIEIVSTVALNAQEAEDTLRRTVAVLAEWEPDEVNVEQLANRVYSSYPPEYVDHQFRETCLCAARTTLDAIST